MATFEINTGAERRPFPHYWETCVGSCHGPTALREDYRRHLRQCHNELGFRYVRFHGILDDSMSVCLKDRNGTLRYNFTLIDSVFDFLLSIDMKPFLELSFMPSALASTGKELFTYRGNISKPRDYAEWDELIGRLTCHLVDRYGLDEVRKWFFEVWNEPNLSFFYEGTQADYFELYDHTCAAIKQVDPLLKVGGPATAINAWLPEMIRHCEENGVPLDFLTTHHYPTDDPLWNSGMSIEAFFEQMFKSGDPDATKKLTAHSRGILTVMLKRAKEEAGDYPLYYTEWNTSSNDMDLRHDVPYSAAFVAKTLIDNTGLVDVYSFWTFSDIFEENGQRPGEFHGGFGLMTLHDIPKPVYRAFQLMHQMGKERLETGGEQGNVGLAATEAGGTVMALCYNHDVLEKPLESETVTLNLKGMEARQAEILRIDEDHANAYPLWVSMGSPDYPTYEQVHALIARSALKAEPLELKDNTVTFTLPAHGVALVKFY